MSWIGSFRRFLTGLFRRPRRGGTVSPSPEVHLETELKRGMRGD